MTLLSKAISTAPPGMLPARPFPQAGAKEGSRSLALGCLLLLAFLVYANSLLNGFVYDDHFQVEQNPYVRGFQHVGSIFTTNVMSFMGKQGLTNYYRPLMTFGYLLCNKAFASLPYGFHLFNILLNCVVVWLVFAVSCELFSDAMVGFAAAAMFALHPVHTEAVAWIAAVTELELAFFFLLSFLLFLRLGSAEGRRLAWIRAGLWFSFLCALLSKEQSMMLPVLAMVYEHGYRPDRRQTSWKTKFGRYGGLWVLGAAYLVFRAKMIGALAPVLQHEGVTGPQLVLSALALTGQYVGKLFWPKPLLAFYFFQKSVSLADPRVLAGLGALLAALALFVFLWRNSRAYSFAVLWIFVTLAPVLNARWMAVNVFAERYLYVPSVGFCWLLGGGFAWAWRRHDRGARWRRQMLSITVVILSVLAARDIFARNQDWRDDFTLLRQTLAIEPRSANARTDYGVVEWGRGNRAEAERQWLLALKDRPNNVIALSNLGMAMYEAKNYDQALAYLRQAIALRPRFAAPHVHLANVYLAQGRSGEAEIEFRRAVELYPLSAQTRNALGRFYLDAGRLAEAEAEFLASTASEPNDKGWDGLGDVYSQQGNSAQAETAWLQSLALEPYDAHAHSRLGSLYLRRGQREPAEKQYQAVLLMDPNNAEALSAMSAAHR